jgi:deoxyhypusine synthase
MKQEWHDGREDGLTPLEAIDLNKVSSFGDLLRAMSKTAFGGRALGEAHDVLVAMASDPDCTIIVTVSGAMTVAKMGRVLCDMIDSEMAHIIVCTGAFVAHGLSEAVGGVHYRHDPGIRDSDLYRMGYNRVYDTLEMEANLYNAETIIRGALNELDWSSPTSSHQICAAIGKYLVTLGHIPSILGNAYQRGVPVYVPAFTDSELGVDIAGFMLARHYTEGKERELTTFFEAVPPFNPYIDLYDFTLRALRAKKLGIFTIGGGVPRNWGQQAAPFIGVLNSRMKIEIPHPRIHYAVRICPEPEHWGGLSGCSYTEGVSWGKFVSGDEGGRFAEVHCDATIAWPLLIKAVLETKRTAKHHR